VIAVAHNRGRDFDFSFSFSRFLEPALPIMTEMLEIIDHSPAKERNTFFV
jgi:hypothetical protein